MKSVLWALSLLFLSSCAHAQQSAEQPQGLMDGRNLQALTLSQALQDVQAGQVVLIGENHGLKTHQQQQLQILQTLRQKGLKVSLGMEFFTYTDQALVDAFRQGQLSEPDFLKQMKWGAPDYGFYRDQVAFPDLRQDEKVRALNAPRSLTGQVSKQGLESLSAELRALLPPNFTLGRDSYKKRFLSEMPHLPTPEAGERYFAAQSIWDDTMAWQTGEFLKAHPEQVLVIIVGEFHTQFGGGLPDRILARLPGVRLWTFSQVDTSGMTGAEIQEAIQPSTADGPRAQFLWLERAR